MPEKKVIMKNLSSNSIQFLNFWSTPELNIKHTLPLKRLKTSSLSHEKKIKPNSVGQKKVLTLFQFSTPPGKITKLCDSKIKGGTGKKPSFKQKKTESILVELQAAEIV